MVHHRKQRCCARYYFLLLLFRLSSYSRWWAPVPSVLPYSSATSSAVLLLPQKDYMLKKSLSLWSKFLVAIMQQQQQQVKALHTLYQLHKQKSACNECASNEWSSNFRSNTENGMSCENAAMPLECKRMCLHIVSLFMW